MSGERRGIDLLGGPRGRRLCLSLLTSADPSLLRIAFDAAHGLLTIDRAQSTGELAEAAAAFGPMTPELTTESAFLGALVETTSAARYWQEPDETDVLLENPQLRAALEPVAAAIACSAASAWWSSPASFGDHHHVQWRHPGIEPPALNGAAARLSSWRERVTVGERKAADWPNDPSALFSGAWWSIPAFAELVTTTRSLPESGALKLMLVEDDLGCPEASVWPLTPMNGTHCYEITGPTAWADLVARFPLDVTLSRRHDWWRSTGLDGTWLIPDWAAVASVYDAVHVTVAGYLTTAGRALPVGEAHTMLAGWNPDETYWLRDVLQSAGPPVEWRRTPGADTWTRSL